MNRLAKLLACSTFLCVAGSIAKADVVTGGVEVSGGASYDYSSLSFVKPFATNQDTGLFAPFAGGTVDYLLGTVDYMDAIGAPLKTFTITNASGDVLTFYDVVNDPTQTLNPLTGFLDVYLQETGFYTINNGPVLAGTFNLQLSGSSVMGASMTVFDGTGEASAFVGDAPEPASCFLMGSGLFGLAGLCAFKRRGNTALQAS